MRTLKLDENNNLVVERNGIVLIDGIDACAQDTKTRIGIVKGEDPYDTDKGADYYNELLGKMGGERYLREEVRKRIMDNDEILGIKRFVVEQNRPEHKLTITADIATIYGGFSL